METLPPQAGELRINTKKEEADGEKAETLLLPVVGKQSQAGLYKVMARPLYIVSCRLSRAT